MRKERRAWSAMKTRCLNPRMPGFEHWGGRGIKVCDRWRWSFANFYADVGAAPTPKHSLDRINNDGDYEPGNVRWATPSQQASNRRPNTKPAKVIVQLRIGHENLEWATKEAAGERRTLSSFLNRIVAQAMMAGEA